MQEMQRTEPLVLGPYYTKGIRFRETAQAIQEERPRSLLSIGCQFGYLESILPDEIQVLSIDNEESYLDTARAVNAAKNNRSFVCLDLFDLPSYVQPDSFDAAIMSEVIEHLEDDVAALRAAGNCVRPGGALFVTVPNINRFPNRIRNMLGKQSQYMTPNHLREYTFEMGRVAIQQSGLVCERSAGVDFRFPKDEALQRVVPIDFAGRRWLATHLPQAATYLLFVCRKPAQSVPSSSG